MFEQIEVNSERWFDLQDLKNEVWKNLKIKKRDVLYNYKNLYKISNYGRVKSLGIYHGRTNNFFKKEHILKARLSKLGYIIYTLSNYGKANYISVHRAVAETFILNFENKPQVNHIDGNKQNNRIDNLEWCTNSENVKHAYNIGLKVSKGKSFPKEKNPNSRFTEKEIKEIREKRQKGYKLKELAKEYNTSESYVCEICKYKFWK